MHGAGTPRTVVRMDHDPASVLPPALAVHVEDFADHLTLQSNRSAHTVRAYTTDVRSLLAHLAHGKPDARVSDIDLGTLRAWLEGRSRPVPRAARSRGARRRCGHSLPGWSARVARSTTPERASHQHVHTGHCLRCCMPSRRRKSWWLRNPALGRNIRLRYETM